jgi:cytochrome c-type biogenesis protein CcmH/NrfG
LSVEKKYEEAVAEKRVAVSLEPNNAQYHFSLANTLTWLDKWAEAEAEYREAVRLDPGNSDYQLKLQKAIDAQKRN